MALVGLYAVAGDAPIGRDEVSDTPALTTGRFRLTSWFIYGPRLPKRKVQMSALGHEQTSRNVRVMSVIPLKADIH